MDEDFDYAKAFAKLDLSSEHVDNVQMGYVFEELIRKFSEQASGVDDLVRQPERLTRLTDPAGQRPGQRRQQSRLHDRQLYTRDGDGWRVTLLYP